MYIDDPGNLLELRRLVDEAEETNRAVDRRLKKVLGSLQEIRAGLVAVIEGPLEGVTYEQYSISDLLEYLYGLAEDMQMRAQAAERALGDAYGELDNLRERCVDLTYERSTLEERLKESQSYVQQLETDVANANAMLY